MAQSLESDGRALTARRLFLTGLALLVILGLMIFLLMLRSNGRFENYTRVVANMVNVGDGLPPQSDVKYHGMIVGNVESVIPGIGGAPNQVKFNLNSRHAKSIPADVTARVIPANVFAVSAMELLGGDPGGPALKTGDRITENTDLPNVVFQTTISKIRDMLAATGRDREDRTIGVLQALQTATQNKRPKLLAAGAQLDRILKDLDNVVATDPDDTTLSALVNATEGLQQSAPELVDALHKAIRPMQVFVEQKAQLSNMLSTGLNSVGLVQTSLANHSDRMVQITGDLTPVFGVLAQKSHHFVPAFQKLNQTAEKFLEHGWNHEYNIVNQRINLSLTPTYTYARADCPTYGELKGNSCFTAPTIPVRPQLPEVLLPQNFQPPKDLAPPRGTEFGENGNLVAVGPPLINPNPNLADPNPPLPPGFTPAPPVPFTANPLNGPPPPIGPGSPPAPVAPNPLLHPGPPPAGPPPPAPGPGAPGGFPAEAAPASYGGNVGPVGSAQERTQLSVLTGDLATPATQLLMAPVVRGTTVTVSASAEGGPR